MIVGLPNVRAVGEFDFFEKEIRPLLYKHCYKCHSTEAEKVEGGLLLDSRHGWVTGGDSGPAIVPGDVEGSLLLRAVSYENSDLQMPPKYKLAEHERAALGKWVEAGAADPRDHQTEGKANSIHLAKGREFWAFRPVVDHAVPKLNPTFGQAENLGEIDRFILSRLTKEGIEPAGLAKPTVLLRRLVFDLTGLPPTPEQLDEFLADPSPEAYARLVDRLLATPQFGETWGRHWLDVARFAESSGGGRSLMFKDAWRFRDYVIDTVNRDKPFDQFIREQIAGDLLPAASREQRNEQIVAAGFLALGPHNYELQDKELLRMEVVDEQIETIGRAFLGMTLGCARCHDHKFDPVSIKDYYALAGIFRSTESLVPGNVSGWVAAKLEPKPELKRAIQRHADETRQADTALKEARKKLREAEALNNALGLVVDDLQAEKIGEWMRSTSNKPFFGDNYIHDKGEDKGLKKVIFTAQLEEAGEYEVRFGYTAGTNRAREAPVTVVHADGSTTIRLNQREQPPINDNFKTLGRFRFGAGRATVSISNANTSDVVIADAVVFLPVGDLNRDPASEERLVGLRRETSRLAKRVEALKKAAPTGSPLAMSVREQKNPADWHVHIRGEIRNKGPMVPRGFLQVAADGNPSIPDGQSGRLQLADWIASGDNPLTSRVMVNRIWHHLLGRGLVATPDNFGTTGDLPSHPELLDWLAMEFVKDGWSVKEMIRRVVHSRAYRRASTGASAGQAADPENRLLWRGNRRRLPAEAIRDTILSVSGQLDTRQGGYTIRKFSQYDWGYEFDTVRRSVYVPMFRNTALELFEVFDAANPNVTTGRRTETTLPTQALFMMNSPFVIAQAKRAGERIAGMAASDAVRVRLAYRLALGRDPRPDEAALAVEFAGQAGAWPALAQSLFASIDFRTLD
ncbi:MAG: DUF1553 domain-containing protein [Verrucomicrobia bacterium]|nr:DUF1553 domain-containing protein [Verrucomicrobiota bacterium]